MCLRIALAALFVTVCSPALAQEQRLGLYTATLGPEDRVNSRGVPLADAASIIRQDRANYHRFGIRHQGDTNDPWFGSTEARAQMQNAIQISPGNANIILQYGAYVAVTVYGQNGRITRITVEIPG